eukprot:6189561-Pleurochrysis_carterae.AAC.3
MKFEVNSPCKRRTALDWHFGASGTIRNDFKGHFELLLGVAAVHTSTHMAQFEQIKLKGQLWQPRMKLTLSGSAHSRQSACWRCSPQLSATGMECSCFKASLKGNPRVSLLDARHCYGQFGRMFSACSLLGTA